MRISLLISGSIALSLIAAASLATVFRATSTSIESALLIQSKVNHFRGIAKGITPSSQTNSASDLAQKPKLDSYPRQPLNLADRVKPGSDFYQFRDRLRQAVRRHNAKFIRSIATSDIRLSLGNPITLNHLDIDNPQAPIWLGMEKAFSTGCAEVDQTKVWICPHISAILPENLDPFQHFAIVGVNVNARSQPSINSQVIGVLSNEVVKFDRKAPPGSYDSDNPNSWVPIVLPGGRRGYVLNRYVYSSVGYRGSFIKKKGEWKMNAFLAGD